MTGRELSSRSAPIRDLVLLTLSKDRDAGSVSGMTGRECHPVMLLYGISLFYSFERAEMPDQGPA